jgi:hypothetical protein
METKQTAVEWLVEQILVEMKDYLNDDYDFDFNKPPKIKYYNGFIESYDLSKYVNQAKQMEKEQIKDAYKIGVAWGHNNMEEYYYSETYNKKDDA